MHFISCAFADSCKEESKQGQNNAFMYYDLLYVYNVFIFNYK